MKDTMTTCRLHMMATAALAVAVSLAALPPTTTASAPASAPEITRVEPATPAPGADPQQLAIQGADFMPGLTLEVTTPGGQTMTYAGGDIQSPKAASFSVMIPLPTEGRYGLVVRNTDGGVSEPYTLTVAAGEPKDPKAPAITAVTPSDPVHGPAPQVLRVAGEGFERGLRAIVTDPMGQELVDVTLGEITPTAFDLTTLLERAGDYEIVVSNPSGTVSNVWTLSVR